MPSPPQQHQVYNRIIEQKNELQEQLQSAYEQQALLQELMRLTREKEELEKQHSQLYDSIQSASSRYELDSDTHRGHHDDGQRQGFDDDDREDQGEDREQGEIQEAMNGEVDYHDDDDDEEEEEGEEQEQGEESDFEEETQVFRTPQSTAVNRSNSRLPTSRFMLCDEDEQENERSVNEVNDCLKKTEDALDQRMKWILKKKSEYLNYIQEMDKQIEELHRTRANMRLVKSNFIELSSPKVRSSSPRSQKKQEETRKVETNSKSAERIASEIRQQRASNEVKEAEQIRMDLVRAQQALLLLKEGVSESSKLPTQELKSIFLQQFLKEFESNFGDLGGSDNEEIEAEEQVLGTVSNIQEDENTRDDREDNDVKSVVQEFEDLMVNNKSNLEFVYLLLRGANNLQDSKKESLLKLLNHLDQFKEEEKKENNQQAPQRTASPKAIQTMEQSKSNDESEEETTSELSSMPKVNEEVLLRLRHDITLSVFSFCNSNQIDTFSKDVLKQLSLLSFEIALSVFSAGKIGCREAELLKSIRDTLKVYEGLEVISSKHALITDIMDCLIEELIFRQAVNSVDTSYQQDIQDLSVKLADVMNRRKMDMDSLDLRRSLSKSDNNIDTGTYDQIIQIEDLYALTKRDQKSMIIEGLESPPQDASDDLQFDGLDVLSQSSAHKTTSSVWPPEHFLRDNEDLRKYLKVDFLPSSSGDHSTMQISDNEQQEDSTNLQIIQASPMQKLQARMQESTEYMKKNSPDNLAIMDSTTVDENTDAEIFCNPQEYEKHTHPHATVVLSPKLQKQCGEALSHVLFQASQTSPQ